MNWLNSNKMRGVLIVVVSIIVVSGGSAKADFVVCDPRPVDKAINSPGARHPGGCSFLHDGLKLYFTSGRDPNNTNARDLWVAERESPDAPWGEAVKLGPNVNKPTANETKPAISPDDLELYWEEYRYGASGYHWMRSTRASKDDPWGPGADFTALGNGGLDFAPDGLSVYFSDSRAGGYGDRDIWVATRATTDDEWGEPVNLGPNVNDAGGQLQPSISSDGLALFFADWTAKGIFMCTRTTTNDSWGPHMDLSPAVNLPRARNPEISPDGSTLYFSSPDSLVYWQISIKPVVDFDADRSVGFGDLLLLIQSWGTDEPLCDIGPMAWGDGVVDDADLEVLMRFWGQQDDPHDPRFARYPKPADSYIVDMEWNAALSWTPGEDAIQHDVYFDTDQSAVADAVVLDTSGIYRGRQDANDYMPPEATEPGQTFYWRIDQVKADYTTYRGAIWSFTVGQFLIVDNFESYNNEFDEGTWEGTTIWNTWIDAYFVWDSGAIVGYMNPPFAETAVVHGGAQAMPFFYDNDGTVWDAVDDVEITGVPYYSQAQRTWEEPQDWTRKGVEILSLWLYGDPENSAEPFYVGLEDNAGNRKDITHPNPAVLTVNDWLQWSIPLADFTDVDLTAVKVMYIGAGDPAGSQPGGSGLVRIDDIELHVPATP